ncbi:holin [Streptomyces sp. NPDC046900]|uniref:holin n=1 Tax=Streptomyces sp. NPDC046900 TaxID=3155473 RepID=UPI0033D96B5E
MSALFAKLKVEAKVWAATTAAFVASVAVSVLNAVQDNHALLGSLPDPLQTIILIVAPTAITFLAGYAAKHTPRPSDGPYPESSS